MADTTRTPGEVADLLNLTTAARADPDRRTPPPLTCPGCGGPIALSAHLGLCCVNCTRFEPADRDDR
jgi:hypothetical protein